MRGYLATSFLGAFNDNFFKLLLVCFIMNTLPQEVHNTFIPLTGAVFVLPFLLCSSYAGWYADRVSKRNVMIQSKWLEAMIMAAGLISFALKNVYALLVVLFFMGAQSALYSPAKYGYLPETQPSDKLSAANGATQLVTFVAIIAGTWFGGFLADFQWLPCWGGSLFSVTVALLGIWTSYAISQTPPGKKGLPWSWNPIGSHLQTIRLLRGNSKFWFAILATTYFWFFSALFQNNLPLFVKNSLGLSDRILAWGLGAVGLGIGCGCASCGRVSRGRIEYGLVLPGGVAMAVVAILTGLFCKGIFGVVFFSAILGFCAGFYQIPVSSAIQRFSPSGSRGACISLANAIDCISMLASYFVQWGLLRFLGMTAAQVFIVLGAITLAVMIYLSWKAPFLTNRLRRYLF